MNALRIRLIMTFVASVLMYQPMSFAGSKKKGHCEIVKDGKVVDLENVKSRKKCKKKGGTWVKDHGHGHADHDHGSDDHDHAH